ncbi:hypothetical protein [Paenibacillus sp. GM2]|nr:hypothetical protein [Paenibacillus sp. GM2]
MTWSLEQGVYGEMVWDWEHGVFAGRYGAKSMVRTMCSMKTQTW